MIKLNFTKPPTLDTISPFFIVSAVSRAIRFYEDWLGFELRFTEPASNPFFAIMGRDSVQVFLKSVPDGIAAQPNHTRHEWAAWDAFVYTGDPDSLAAEFVSRGLAFHKAIADRSDGLRGFEVSDPDGYILFFGRTN